MSRPTSYRQLFKSTGLLGSVQVLQIGISVVRNKAAALLIGAAGMGLVDLYSRSLELVGNATNFGLGLSAMRRLSEKAARVGERPERLAPLARLVRTWVLLTALLGTLVCLLFAPLISLMSAGNLSQTAAYALLSPAVGLATLSAGEMALLKSMRRLRRLARASLLTAVLTLALCLSLYALCGMDGIVPVLVLGAAMSYGCCLRESRRDFPLRLGPMRGRFLRRGVPLLRLGTAYILAGVVTALAEMLVRAVLVRSADGLETVGHYAAGLTLTMSYARMVFVAMDADYFPRLSAMGDDRREMNLLVNRQINTLAVLMAPFLLLFCLMLPLVVRLLYTADFLVIVPMVAAASASMYFKAVYTPVAYLPLARGHSLLYMGMELAYDGMFCLLVIVGLHFGGLLGAGLGLSLANLFDLVAIGWVYGRRYGFRMNRATRTRCLLLFLLLVVGLVVSACGSLPVRAGCGVLLLLLCLPMVWPILRRVLKRK